MDPICLQTILISFSSLILCPLSCICQQPSFKTFLARQCFLVRIIICDSTFMAWATSGLCYLPAGLLSSKFVVWSEFQLYRHQPRLILPVWDLTKFSLWRKIPSFILAIPQIFRPVLSESVAFDKTPSQWVPLWCLWRSVPSVLHHFR